MQAPPPAAPNKNPGSKGEIQQCHVMPCPFCTAGWQRPLLWPGPRLHSRTPSPRLSLKNTKKGTEDMTIIVWLLITHPSSSRNLGVKDEFSRGAEDLISRMWFCLFQDQSDPAWVLSLLPRGPSRICPHHARAPPTLRVQEAVQPSPSMPVTRMVSVVGMAPRAAARRVCTGRNRSGQNWDPVPAGG